MREIKVKYGTRVPKFDNSALFICIYVKKALLLSPNSTLEGCVSHYQGGFRHIE